MKPNLFLIVFIVIQLLLNTVNTSYAATQNVEVKPLTQADLQQHIQTITDKQNLSDEVKKRIQAIYADSEDNLKEAQAQEAQAETFKQSMTSLPLESKHLQKQIADADDSLKNRKQEKLALFPTDELEQRLIIEKTHLSDLDAEISRVDGLINQHLNRPQLIREKIAEIKNKQGSNQIEQQGLALHGTDRYGRKRSHSNPCGYTCPVAECDLENPGNGKYQ